MLFLQGEYFFELDDKSILPGYPKLIQDVWGISGPIDAAFTRINCQGKSYIFKVETSVSLESLECFDQAVGGDPQCILACLYTGTQINLKGEKFVSLMVYKSTV